MEILPVVDGFLDGGVQDEEEEVDEGGDEEVEVAQLPNKELLVERTKHYYNRGGFG